MPRVTLSDVTFAVIAANKTFAQYAPYLYSSTENHMEGAKRVYSLYVTNDRQQGNSFKVRGDGKQVVAALNAIAWAVEATAK